MALQAHDRSPRVRIAGVLFAPLVMLALFAVALAVLLAVSPLWELPDTYCQTVLRPPVGGGCAEVTSRRWHWIAVVLLTAVVLAACAVLVRPRSRGTHTTGLVQVGLLLAAFAVAVAGAVFLTVGRDSDECGSTLSRLDPDGSYAPARPIQCAPSYAASRQDAGICIGVAVAAVAAATARGVRRRASSV